MKWKIVLMACLVTFCLPLKTNAEVSNYPIHWGFKKGVNEQQGEAGPRLDQLLDKYCGFYKGDANSKILYLTFDNGYENGYTAQMLDVLKKEKVPAAFFVTGHYLDSASDLVKRMAKEGHIIGNHSWFHPDLTTINDAKIQQELEKVRSRNEELTGKKEMKYLRPPRGVLSERTLKVAKELGYTHVMWSLAYVDWKVDQQKGPQFAYHQVMTQLHPGAVILLHSISKDNADALEKIIVDAKKKGYTFKSLDDFPQKVCEKGRQ